MGVIEMAAPLLRWAGLAAGAAGVALALYAAVLALLWWGQEKLLFMPEKLPATHRFDVGTDVHETWVDVPGARLHALHLRRPAPAGLAFYLHGNAGSLEGWFVNVDLYRRANFDLFMIDYRGYGKSSGRIQSQAQLLDDVRAAWAQVAPHYAGLRRVIIGRSLGSGLAAQLAAEVQPEHLVLASPYASMAQMAAELYPWVPQALLRYPLRTDLILPQVRSPVLLIHGARDDFIAPAHAQRLAALAPQARLLLLPQAGHNDLQMYPAYLQALEEVMQGR